MKTLQQSLIDYEMTLLKAIAERRALPLNAVNQNEAVDRLAEALLSPAATAIIVEDLSAAEKQALQFLLALGGQANGPRFTREYGAIRPMGPARLERERPWESPANPAEGLWYRGLIFKAFQVTGQGSEEVVYIPTDLRPYLAAAFPQIELTKRLNVSQTTTPVFVISAPNRLRENFFSLLVYLQTTPVRLSQKNELPAAAQQSLSQGLLPPLPTWSLADEVDFLLHLGQRAKLITVAHGRLRPERETMRRWLQANPSEQVRWLQNTWRPDPTWNDLWHVPGLEPQPTGWENSPLRARSQILGFIEQLKAEPGAWYSLENFIMGVKQFDPDFQRPNGNYESWYLKDMQGNLLMGFEHWDDIEGELIRYIITQILLLLGVVELGCSGPNSPPESFSLTALGRAFLTNQPGDSPAGQEPALFRLNSNLQVRLPAQASLYDRFQLARFAELDRRETNRVLYKITQASINRAIKNGVTSDQITAFLTRVTNNQIPLKAVEAIRAWGTRYATVKLEQAILLRLKSAELATELRQHPQLGPLLGETLNPDTLIIPDANISEVRRLLTELGYLE
jgi:hypothetical protein